MKILCDDAVFAAERVLGELVDPSDVRLLPGRELASSDLGDVEVLVTRTVTKIDAALLGRAPRLKMVASASAGFDHVDFEALDAREVHFAHAPACNALAVTQWVAAAWTLMISRPAHRHRAGARVGVVGHGEVGRRVAQMYRIAGHEVWCCDPVRARESPTSDYRPLEELLEGCDLLTLHVPLTRAGEDATLSLVRREQARIFLEAGGAIINTSRGEVLELPETVPEGSALILDVWPGEPHLPWAWIDEASAADRLIATPHIAGYSAEAKLRGVTMVARAIAEQFDRPDWQAPPVELTDSLDNAASLPELTRVELDHARLVAVARLGREDATRAATQFTRLRRNYEHRREFAAHRDLFETGGALSAHAGLLALN